MLIAESRSSIPPYEKRSGRSCWEAASAPEIEKGVAEILTSSTLCSRLGGVRDARISAAESTFG